MFQNCLSQLSPNASYSSHDAFGALTPASVQSGADDARLKELDKGTRLHVRGIGAGSDGKIGRFESARGLDLCHQGVRTAADREEVAI